MADFAGARKPAAKVSAAPDPDVPGTVSPITRELSEYIAAALAQPLPEEVAEKAKRHLLDTLAAMVVGLAAAARATGDRVCARAGRPPAGHGGGQPDRHQRRSTRRSPTA